MTSAHIRSNFSKLRCLLTKPFISRLSSVCSINWICCKIHTYLLATTVSCRVSSCCCMLRLFCENASQIPNFCFVRWKNTVKKIFQSIDSPAPNAILKTYGTTSQIESFSIWAEKRFMQSHFLAFLQGDTHERVCIAFFFPLVSIGPSFRGRTIWVQLSLAQIIDVHKHHWCKEVEAIAEWLVVCAALQTGSLTNSRH